MTLYGTRIGSKINLVLFLAVHLACLAGIWTGVPAWSIGLCALLYFLRMFGVTAGYHRYFSHRTFKMGRVTQFFTALLAMSSAQKGVIWWAAHHRHHHRHSDSPDDMHSPRDGFWHAHCGWILSSKFEKTRAGEAKDLMKFPELVWLDRHPVVPPVLLGVLVYLLFGWTGLVVGFLWSTVLVWHITFTINSLSHIIGRQRYQTGDDSRNNWLLALLTLGEGWHNNHHHYQRSTSQGFYWWEYDVSYYLLWILSKTGLVWDLRKAPRHIVTGDRHPEVVGEIRRKIEKKRVTAL